MLFDIWFCLKKMKYYEGIRYVGYGTLDVVTGILVPFLQVWFPSFVLALLTKELGLGRDEGINNLQITEILDLVGLIMAGGAMILFFQGLKTVLDNLYENAASRTRMMIGTEYFQRILELPYGELESQSGKEMAERALKANFHSRQYGTEGILMDSVSFLTSLGGIILYGSMVINLHPLLVLLLILCPLPGALLAGKKRNWMQEHKKDRTPYDVKHQYLGDVAVDPKKGKDIRLYQLDNWLSDSYGRNMEAAMCWQKEENKKEFQVKAMNRLMGLLRGSVCYGYLFWQVLRQNLSVADFVLYLGIIRGFSDWMTGIVSGWNRLVDHHLVMKDYYEFMGMRSEEEFSEERRSLSKEVSEIRMEEVSFSYPGTEKEVLSGINLNLRQGEKVALVGLNGAGKTTLVKLLTGLYQPSQGRILLDGIDGQLVEKADWQDIFSVVFQDASAFAFSLDENISCQPEQETDGRLVRDCLEAAGLWEKIESLPLGVHTPLTRELDEKGTEFSGGELQKLMLARALYKQGPVVILDEPTSALDPLAERELYEKYQELTHERISLFISHRLSSTQFCDRIIFLKEGKITEEGTHETLMQLGGDYAEMYEKQAFYYQKTLKPEVESNEG